MSFLRLFRFSVVVLDRVPVSFHASTDFGFAHVSKLDFRVFLIFVLAITGHIIILGIIGMIQFAKHIQLVDG